MYLLFADDDKHMGVSCNMNCCGFEQLIYPFVSDADVQNIAIGTIRSKWLPFLLNQLFFCQSVFISCLQLIFFFFFFFFVAKLQIKFSPRFFVDVRVLCFVGCKFAKVFSYDGHMVVNL
jgi:hypothetical protein